jgi:hypothetical protein
MPKKPKTPPKQRIALGSPAFDKIMVESGGAQIFYPTQPFKYGYKVYWFDSKPPNFGRRLPLSDNEISLIKRFMDGEWDLQRFEKEDLQRLKARLVQKCNVQSPNELTWDDILFHIREYLSNPKKPSGGPDLTEERQVKITYDDIRKELANWTTFVQILKKDISSGQIRNYGNVLNALKRLGRIIWSREIEDVLLKQNDKIILRRHRHLINSIEKLQDIVSDSISKPDSYIKVTNRLDDLIDHSNKLSDLLAEERQKIPASGGKTGDIQNDKALTKEALALAMLVEHPDWPDTKIAKAVGVSRTTLYDWSNFKKAKETLKQGKNHLPKGSKDGKTGKMEAWETDTLADT